MAMVFDPVFLRFSTRLIWHDQAMRLTDTQRTIIHAAWQNNVKRLLFLGSSCASTHAWRRSR
jgi:hypothetical protein